MKYVFHENKVPQDGSMNLQNNREITIKYFIIVVVVVVVVIIFRFTPHFIIFSYLNDVKVDISDYELQIDLNLYCLW